MYEFLHFGIHENAFTTTENALIPQHLGALPPGPLAGALPPAPPLGHSSQTSFAPQHDFLDPPLEHKPVRTDFALTTIYNLISKQVSK